MAERPPRVVLLSLDGVDPSAVAPERTPRLWGLARGGGMTPGGGWTDLPSVTYPSHATMLTGRRSLGHGVTSNLAAAPRPGTVPGWAGAARVASRSLFEACREAGVRSAAVLGDHKLYGIVGAGAADAWPPGGDLPEGTPVDPHGYPLNAAIRPHLLRHAADRDLPFLFGHINEPDTWGHRFGPDDPQTIAAYAAADALVGEVADALRPDWSRTLLVVLSDHGMERAAEGPPIDLLAHPGARDLVAEAVDEGGCAYVRLRDGVAPEQAAVALERLPGVASWRRFGDGALLLEGEPGSVFASGTTKSVRGVHGGPGTQRTIAIVAGGHPIVPPLAAAIRRDPPHLADWAPAIASLLGLSLPEADGRLLARAADS